MLGEGGGVRAGTGRGVGPHSQEAYFACPFTKEYAGRNRKSRSRPRSQSRTRERLTELKEETAAKAQAVMQDISRADAYDLMNDAAEVGGWSDDDDSSWRSRSWGAWQKWDQWQGWRQDQRDWWARAEQEEERPPPAPAGLEHVQGPTFFRDPEGHVYNEKMHWVDRYGQVKHRRGARAGDLAKAWGTNKSYTLDSNPVSYDPSTGTLKKGAPASSSSGNPWRPRAPAAGSHWWRRATEEDDDKHWPEWTKPTQEQSEEEEMEEEPEDNQADSSVEN